MNGVSALGDQSSPVTAGEGPDSALPNLAVSLAAHDAQIRALQQAVSEMANSAGVAPQASALGVRGEDVSALRERITFLETRLAEQDHMIRHTLTMLIEWIEINGADRNTD